MVKTKQERNGSQNKSLWTVEEDKILMDYVNAHGKGRWNSIAKTTGLKRCGKSCRLRWINYLSPNVKRDNFSEEEEDLIVRLHNLLGNRWSLIAKRVPGRTDNQVKNYWNTHLSKKLGIQKKRAPSNGTNSKSSEGSSASSVNRNSSTVTDILTNGGASTSDGKDSRESKAAFGIGETVTPEDDSSYRTFWDFESELRALHMEFLGEQPQDLAWLHS